MTPDASWGSRKEWSKREMANTYIEENTIVKIVIMMTPRV